MDIDLRGLENQWEIECVDFCAHCKLPIGEDEVPLRLFTDDRIPLTMAFHMECAQKRISTPPALSPRIGAGPLG